MLTVQPVHLLAVAVILALLFLSTGGNQGGGIAEHNKLAKHAAKHPTAGSSKSGHGGSSHRGNNRDKGTAAAARLDTPTPTVDGAGADVSGTVSRKFGLGRFSLFQGWAPGGDVPPAASSSESSASSSTPGSISSLNVKVEEAEEEAGGRGGGGKAASMKRMKPIDFTAVLGLVDPAAGSAMDMSGSSVGAVGGHHRKHHKGDPNLIHPVVDAVVVSRDELDMLHPKPECNPVNCAGRWSGWSKCDTQCGTGSERRRYTVTHLAACGGHACRYQHGEEQERPCVGSGTNCCPGKVTFFLFFSLPPA